MTTKVKAQSTKPSHLRLVCGSLPVNTAPSSSVAYIALLQAQRSGHRGQFYDVHVLFDGTGMATTGVGAEGPGKSRGFDGLDTATFNPFSNGICAFDRVLLGEIT